MGSDQSKCSADNSSARRHVSPKGSTTRAPLSYQESQAQKHRPEAVEDLANSGIERARQPYSYTQINLMTATLDHVITHNYPTAAQSPSHLSGQEVSTQRPECSVTITQRPSTASTAPTASFQPAPKAQGAATTSYQSASKVQGATTTSYQPASKAQGATTASYQPAPIPKPVSAAQNLASIALSPKCTAPDTQRMSGAAQKSSYSVPEQKAAFAASGPSVSKEDFLLVHPTRSHSRGPAQNTSSPTTSGLNINCQTCDLVYTENIYQCNRGHSACERCKERNACCRVCTHPNPITDTQNFALQDAIYEIKIPCHNAREGCKLSFKIGDMGKHLSQCPFGELDCPLTAIYGRCSWRGKHSQLVEHFDTTHPENRQANVDQEMLLSNIYYDEKYVHLVDIGCYKFLVHLRISETKRNVYITVQLIGTNNSANNWIYDIHVYNKREPRRKYMFSDSCHPIGKSAEEICEEAKCAVLPLPFALTFFKEGVVTEIMRGLY